MAIRKGRVDLVDSEGLEENKKLAPPELSANVNLHTSSSEKILRELPLLPENWCSTPGVPESSRVLMGEGNAGTFSYVLPWKGTCPL